MSTRSRVSKCVSTTSHPRRRRAVPRGCGSVRDDVRLELRGSKVRFADHPGIEKAFDLLFSHSLRETNKEVASPRRFGAIWP
jgi:hypothetical protein